MYNSTIISFVVNNGTDAFDVRANPGVTFDAQLQTGYSVSFTLHTASTSSQGNTNLGATWYNNNAFGFANGVCVDNAGPNQDITVELSNVKMGQATDGMLQTNVYWNSLGNSNQQVTYNVKWHDSPPPPTTTSQLTVDTQDTSGTAINGYYTVLYQNKASVATGFSPATFTLNNGQTYTVQVQDYGDYVFDHWQDTSSTDRIRIISITTGTQITAIYRNNNNPPPPPPDGQSEISVGTTDSSGNAINGYYTTFWQGSTMLHSCFSPCFFTANNGEYQVAVADYDNKLFDHWSDGIKNRFHDVSAGGGTIDLVAVYRTTS
jgi:hypothetical protein